MTRLALTDLRVGTVVLAAGPTLAAVPGDAPLQLYGMARLPDGRLVLTDRPGHRIVAMAEDGSDWASFGGPGAGLDDLSSVDRTSMSIPQFDTLDPDARVIEGNASGALCKYAIVFDQADDEGVYDLTVTVSPEPPGQV